jgi:uncharacterized Zn finger protein (UPF0148 family)
MCGSTNLLKQDGVFVCQSCGTKYSVEEAKKMMVEGTVNVEGTVKIDTSSELRNLYEIARRAKDSDNAENAEKYYDMILVKDPTSWEATFYVVYFKAVGCKIAEIWSAGSSVNNVIEPTVNLIAKISDEEEQSKALNEVSARLSEISDLLYNGATSHYNGIDIQIQSKFVQEFVNNVTMATQIQYTFGDILETKFGDKYNDTLCYLSWVDAVDKHSRFVKFLVDKEGNKQIINAYVEKICKINPEYKAPEINTGGCYIATAVYGSYDCPEVWTLRRFRDYTLAETWYGRIFIKTYYAVSPTLVKWFGQTEWFKSIFRMPLEKLVSKLNKRGFDNTPYND